jgi:hypothetical protein
MEKINANSVNACTDESVMEFLESTQERDTSVTAEFVQAEVLAKVKFACRRRIRRCALSSCGLLFAAQEPETGFHQ